MGIPPLSNRPLRSKVEAPVPDASRALSGVLQRWVGEHADIEAIMPPHEMEHYLQLGSNAHHLRDFLLATHQKEAELRRRGASAIDVLRANPSDSTALDALRSVHIDRIRWLNGLEPALKADVRTTHRGPPLWRFTTPPGGFLTHDTVRGLTVARLLFDPAVFAPSDYAISRQARETLAPGKFEERAKTLSTRMRETEYRLIAQIRQALAL